MTADALVSALAAFGTHIGPWIGGAIPVAVAVRKIMDGWTPLRKMKVDHDQAVITNQNARIDKLEALIEASRAEYERKLQTEREAHAQTRADLEAKIEGLRQLYESKLDVERSRHEREESLSRHKVRNLDGCFKAFLWMAARTDDLPEIVAEVRRMRAEQEIGEVAERAAALGERVAAATLALPAPETSASVAA